VGILLHNLGDILYKYRHIKNDSKLLYVYLYDLYYFSDNHINYKGEKYIIFTNYEIMEKFNCSNATAVRIKKQLVDNGLIEIVSKGFSKLIKVKKEV
jgi:hypothetical protein